MTYLEAQKWREKNLSRIGSTDEKGFVVDELLIVPSDDDARDAFFKQYIIETDQEIAIKSYVDKDMQVWAVDTRHLQLNNVLFYNILKS